MSGLDAPSLSLTVGLLRCTEYGLDLLTPHSFLDRGEALFGGAKRLPLAFIKRCATRRNNKHRQKQKSWSWTHKVSRNSNIGTMELSNGGVGQIIAVHPELHWDQDKRDAVKPIHKVFSATMAAAAVVMAAMWLMHRSVDAHSSATSTTGPSIIAPSNTRSATNSSDQSHIQREAGTAGSTSTTTQSANVQHRQGPTGSLPSPNQAVNKPGSSRTATHSVQPSRRTDTAATRLLNSQAHVQQEVERDLALYFQAHPVEDSIRERLQNAEVELRLDDRTTVEVGREQGLTFEQIDPLRRQVYDKFTASAKDILGPEKGAQFTASVAAIMFIPIAQHFASECAAAGEPLDALTIEAVAINLGEHLPNPDFPPHRILLPNGIEVAENEAMKAAAKVLSPAQMELFKKLWARKPYPETPYSPARF